MDTKNWNRRAEAAGGRAFARATGGTPLVEISAFARSRGGGGGIGGGVGGGSGGGTRLFAKLERANPAGSIKDRVALAMICDALDRGLIERGSAIVEPTSGNTGIALAALGRAAGLEVILTMPDNMSPERRALLRAYGARLELTPGDGGMTGAIARAKEIVSGMKGAWMPDQFNNPANPLAHYRSTGPEIWRQTEGGVDVFVCGVGTGGTISGVGRYLKSKKPDVRVVAVEPDASPVLTRARSETLLGATASAAAAAALAVAGRHGIQGIGAGFVPGTLDMSAFDEVMRVTDEDAYMAAEEFAREEGLLVGPSSGAALFAACAIASRNPGEELTIVVAAPDSGERYLSEVRG